ncbi:MULTISPECIES: MetS family NSS transporter small subunit [unclassified Candidatus Frackibacter]|nr:MULTISPECIES: MetS family NSS transporter small subunit [unclassified Candidatus Frackibacter]
MPGSAIAMLIFGCIVLYGGLGYCLNIAIKSNKDK